MELGVYGDILDGLIVKMNDQVTINDDDYLNDEGLWMCGKCHTEKQVRIDILGLIREPMCLCKCEKEKREAEENAQKKLLLAEKVEGMRKAAFPDSKMASWRFENDDQKDKKLSGIARRYVEHWDDMRADGKGLIFYGETGTGKTYMAAAIANALIDKGVSCLVTNFARLINEISGTFEKQAVIDGLNAYTLLVIDDLAAERDTEYMGETVFNIIDARYRSGKPMIVTTNLSGEELTKPTDLRKKRVFSRIYEMCLPVKVEGTDRRKAKLRDDVGKYAEILGGAE